MSASSSIQIARDGDVAVVVLQGEHDLSTADRLRQAIERARDGSTPVVVDLTEATFIVGTAASSANLSVTELNYNPIVADEEFI